MLFLYNALLVLLSPLWVPWMWWRARKRKEPVDWKERRGRYPSLGKPGKRPRIWFHAVSVGEVIAARPILRRLRAHRSNPEIILSVTTSSGHSTAEQTPELWDHLRYAPIDLMRFTLPAMQATRPHVLAILETELWLSWLDSAQVFDAATMLVNGRISPRAYRTSRRFGFFYRHVLKRVDRVLMQSASDAERIRTLGAENAEVLGNVKFDEAREAPTRGRAAWREAFGWPEDAPVVIVGSTRGEAEERFVLAAIARLPDTVRVLHAPRHLERVPALCELVRAQTGDVALFSENPSGARYVVLDAYGVLADAYAVADVAIVGGGFEPFGGQNILQPLARGVPTLHGPHMANFRDVAALAADAGATGVAASAEELAAAIERLLDDPDDRARRGRAALELFERHAGAADRYADAILGAAAEARATMERRDARLRARAKSAGRSSSRP